jgi:hypothetical protein
LRATVVDDGGIANVDLFLNGNPAGSGNTIPLEAFAESPGTAAARIFAITTDNEGLSATSFVVTAYFEPELIARGSEWKFNDAGIDLGTAWRKLDFDDSAWASGVAELGYGDGDEVTLVSFGPNPFNKYITTYFRRTFVVPNPAEFTNVVLQLLQDDGAVAYLNDVEVARSFMPSGEVVFETRATASLCCSEETSFREFNIDPGLFLAGTNVIAVEVHQGSVETSDMSFDLALLGQTRQESPPLALRFAGNALELSWSANQIGYALEATDNLAPPIQWQPVNAPVARDLMTHSATITNLAGSKFFRLRRQ